MPITAEEFTAFIATDEGQEMFATKAEELGFKTAIEVEKLRKNNQKLLDQKGKAQDRASEFETASENFQKTVDLLRSFDLGLDDGEEVEYDSIERVLTGLKDRVSSSGDSEQTQQELAKIQRELEVKGRENKKLTTQVGVLSDFLSERDGVIAGLLIDGEFKAALREAGYMELVIPNILPALRMSSGAKVQKNDETDEYEAIVNDGGSIREWVELWKDSDEGKALRPGSGNTGGGNHSSVDGVDTSKKFADMSGAERTALYNKSPELYRKLKNQG